MWMSEKQKKILDEIKTLMEWKVENMWFVQAEIPDLTMHTIIALKEKGFLDESENPFGVKVYKWTWKELK